MSQLGNLLKGTKPDAENAQACCSPSCIQSYSKEELAPVSNASTLHPAAHWHPGLAGHHWDKQRGVCQVMFLQDFNLEMCVENIKRGIVCSLPLAPGAPVYPEISCHKCHL